MEVMGKRSSGPFVVVFWHWPHWQDRVGSSVPPMSVSPCSLVLTGLINVGLVNKTSSWGVPFVSSLGEQVCCAFFWMLRSDQCDIFPKEKRKNVPLLPLQERGFLLDPQFCCCLGDRGGNEGGETAEVQPGGMSEEMMWPRAGETEAGGGCSLWLLRAQEQLQRALATLRHPRADFEVGDSDPMLLWGLGVPPGVDPSAVPGGAVPRLAPGAAPCSCSPRSRVTPGSKRLLSCLCAPHVAPGLRGWRAAVMDASCGLWPAPHMGLI